MNFWELVYNNRPFNFFLGLILIALGIILIYKRDYFFKKHPKVERWAIWYVILSILIGNFGGGIVFLLRGLGVLP